MTSLELFRAMGGVSTENLAQADALQRMEQRPVRRRHSVKQAALIAAVIALLLLLVGCAAVYVLHLQDLKVGDFRLSQNPAYDADGNRIPVPTHPLHIEFSLQGNPEALAEWEQFKEEYDPALEIAIAYDNGQGDTGIPDNYYYPYGCYSWEMVEKLDEIIGKYNLKLLSEEVICNYGEADVLFGALGIDSVFAGEAEYGNSYFYPEGAFHLDMTIDETYAAYHYSPTGYFDLKGFVLSETELENSTQWNYTRKDGQSVLLVSTPEKALILADMPQAFISVEFSLWTGNRGQMTKDELEAFAEGFDLDPQPQAVDMTKVETLRAEVKAASDARRAEKNRLLYTQGYESYVAQMLESARDQQDQDGMFYALYDLNGDGTPELLPGGKRHVMEILSLRDGESYQYADFAKLNMFGIWKLTVCQNNVLALYDLLSERQWFYLRAGDDGVSYLEGLGKNPETGEWYSLPEPPPASPQQPVKVAITPEQAQAIQASYVPLEEQPERQQMKRYGEPVEHVTWSDPYSQFIWEISNQYVDGKNLTYALMDLNGDGVEELITTDFSTPPRLEIRTIVNGELVVASDTSFSGICENGILMDCDDDGTYYGFYRMEGTEMVMIERFFQEPVDLYWSRAVPGMDPSQGQAYSEADAMKLIQAYKPIDLPMKPFSEYPLH